MDNPLGISTGQGKGLAQVFGDTYNDYYKQKADEGAKKKAEIEAAMAKSSAGVWDRDLGLFKPMREELRKYVQDNARDIIDGKFDANVGWQAKQDELLQFINSSKAAKAFYESTLKLYNNNPEKYSDLSKDDILRYAATPGDFSNNIILEGKFDSQASKKAMLDALSKVQYNTFGVKEMTLPSGKKYAVETSAQRKEAAKEILDSQRDFDLKNFPRQARNFWTQQEYDNQLAALENSLGSKTTFKEESSFETRKPWGKEQLENQVNRRKVYISNLKTDNIKLANDELANLIGRVNKSNKKKVVEAVMLKAGEEGVPNNTVKIVYEGQNPSYFDVSDLNFDKTINAEISSINGMDDLNDNDLDLLPDIKIPKVESKGDLRSSSLKSLLKGDDLDTRIREWDKKDKELKSIKDSELKDKIRSGYFNESGKITDLLTNEFKGNQFRGGTIESVTYESNNISSDEYIVVLEKPNGVKETINIELKDDKSVDELVDSSKKNVPSTNNPWD